MSRTVILRPTANGQVNNSSNVIGNWHNADGLAYAQINEENLDDNTYWGIYTNQSNYSSNTVRKSFVLANVALSGSIVSVEVYFRVAGHQVYSMKPLLYTHGNTYYGTQRAPAPENTKATYSHSWATNPNTGAPWTWDEINALEAGVEMSSSGASGDNYSSAQNYWLYVVVTYNPAAAPRSQVIGIPM